MGGLAGILNVDGSPAQGARLDAMLRSIAHRGRGVSVQAGPGPVVMGRRSLHPAGDAPRGYEAPAGAAGIVATFDGHIDNRLELRKALDSASLDGADADQELISLAYRKWGIAFVSRIVGEFALALWDASRRELYLARDYLGRKPLYYCLDKRVLVWGSELQQVAREAQLALDPNEAFLARYLAYRDLTSVEDTVLRNVRRVAPAHVLAWRNGKLLSERYWDLEGVPLIEYRRDEDYEEHFTELFDRAVACRMAGTEGVAADLSGGLDSSSVVATARKLIPAGETAARDFRSFSVIFPGLPCDESTYIEDVARHTGVPSIRVAYSLPGEEWYTGQARRYLDLPDDPTVSMLSGVRQEMRSAGIGTLLTGHGGDDLLAGSFMHYADLLRSRRFAELHARLKHDPYLRSYVPRASNPLMYWLFGPFVPPVAAKWWRGTHPRPIPDWINRDLFRRTGARDRRDAPIPWREFRSFTQADLYANLTSGRAVAAREMQERSAAWFGYVERHPFEDRRLAEFCLSIPETQRWRGSCEKWVLRRAMGDRLPASVRCRTSKAEFSCIIAEALSMDHVAKALGRLSEEARQWVDQDVIHRMYGQVTGKPRGSSRELRRDARVLWSVYQLEIWLAAIR